MKLTILCDNSSSWIVPYTQELKAVLIKRGHDVAYVGRAEEISQGDCAFFLGCEKMVPKEVLARNTHNIVVHESALPQGRGWSPLTWQILEGRNDIPVTLFEAREPIDSGDIYSEDALHFEGHELVDELRTKQGEATIALILKFVDTYPKAKGRSQEGKETRYEKRTPKDSELDPEKTLAEQFDLLRIVDNERYPAFFTLRGHTYILKISKKDT